MLGMETRVGVPSGLAGRLVEEGHDPKFATGVGLVLYGLQPEIMGATPFLTDVNDRVLAGVALNGNGHSPSLVHKIADRMKSWFDEL